MDECTNFGLATKCLTGYTLWNGCCAVIGTAGSSTGTAPMATECNTGYVLNAGVCTKCKDSGASACSNSDNKLKHIGCLTGYFLSSTGCTACTDAS